jgi:TonB-dependent SusC/RagA subfamily outer membrane receptor
MRRNVFIASSLLAGACMPSKAKVVAAPASSAAATCSQERAAAITYFVDGKSATCTSVMALPASRIASVEVLKGAAALSLYGAPAGVSVVIIQTKREDR